MTATKAVGLRTLFLLTAVFLWGCLPLLSAQQHTRSIPAQPSENPVFKSVVNRVILDVVVTDSVGKPVHGLTQQDFSIAEDGQTQRVLSFDVHDLESASEFPRLPPLPPNTFVNVPTAPERGPLYILLLDLVNTGTDEQAFARRQLLNFIADKPQGTRFAVLVLSDGLHLLQGFTGDQKQLYAVLDPSHPRPHLPRILLYGRNYYSSGLGVLEAIAQYLDGLPGRKNLIWFSEEFPVDFFATDDDTTPAYREELKRTLNTMAQSQIAIYPVDVAGVSVDATVHERYLREDVLADATGGRAYYSDNGLKDMLDEAVEHGANYYTLTYSPSNVNYDGSLRKIRVQLAKKGCRLAYRRSYFAYDPSAPFPETVKNGSPDSSPLPPPRKLGDSLYANMQHGAPLAHQLFFRAHVRTLGEPAMATPVQMSNLEDQPAYFRVRRKNRPLNPLAPVKLQPYVIDYTFIAGAPKQAANGHAIRPPKLEVAVAAFDEDGRMLNGMVDVSASTEPVSAAQNPQGIYRVQQQLDVPLAATSIRFAVRDISTDNIGAMEVPLPLAPEAETQVTPPPHPGPSHPETPNPN